MRTATQCTRIFFSLAERKETHTEKVLVPKKKKKKVPGNPREHKFSRVAAQNKMTFFQQ